MKQAGCSMRRAGWAVAMALLVCGHAATAVAEDAYPNRPIRLVSPYSPGGNVDFNARYLAKKLQDSMGVPVFVENKPGASSVIGTEYLARSKPDGYTIMMVGAGGSTHTVNPSFFAKLPYDSINDFAPVSLFSRVPLVLTTTLSLPVKNLQELIALGKAKPQSLSAASGGDGTASDLGAQMFMSIAGLSFPIVHYKGNAPALTDTVSGQVQMMFDTLSTVLQQVKAGRVRAIAVSSPQRSPLIPDVPTVLEAGFPGLEMEVNLGVLAPAGTPRPILNRLAEEIAKTTRDPEARQYFAAQAVELISSKPDEFSAFIKTDIARWEKITRETGLKPR